VVSGRGLTDGDGGLCGGGGVDSDIGSGVPATGVDKGSLRWSGAAIGRIGVEGELEFVVQEKF
jgi:hypothetical protein